MKEIVFDWAKSINKACSCNKKEVFFWVQFILFFLSNIDTHAENYVRVTILAMYVLGLVYFVLKKPNFKRPPTYLIVIFGLYFILNTIFIKTFSVHIIYCVITFLMIRELKFTSKELLSIINKVAIVYLVISILVNYTPLRVLSIYDTRLVVNKFFPHLLFRFIGIEGSPAGPDIFYLLVLISNIVINKNKNKYFYIVLSIAILLWTSSIAPIFSIVGALILLPFIKNRVMKTMYSVMICVYQFIVIILYGIGSTQVRLILNTASTMRARVWFNMFSDLLIKSNPMQWMLGRKGLVGFENTVGYFINNPHNYSLFIMQFGGLFIYATIIFILTLHFRNMNDKYKLCIVAALLIYASTNTFILTIRGNPIFIFVLVTYLSSGSKREMEPHS